MSNFSAQYRNFKNRNQAKSHERRKIKNVAGGKMRKNLIASDLYFHGQVTSDEEQPPNSKSFNQTAMHTAASASLDLN